MSLKCADPAGGAADGVRSSLDDRAGQPIDDLITPQHLTDQQRAVLIERQLQIFARHCRRMRERVDLGATSFVDAIDTLYEGAVYGGLVEVTSDSIVQTVMHQTFCRVRR